MSFINSLEEVNKSKLKSGVLWLGALKMYLKNINNDKSKEFKNLGEFSQELLENYYNFNYALKDQIFKQLKKTNFNNVKLPSSFKTLLDLVGISTSL